MRDETYMQGCVSSSFAAARRLCWQEVLVTMLIASFHPATHETLGHNANTGQHIGVYQRIKTQQLNTTHYKNTPER